MRKKSEISKYMDEAFDRVWLVRTQDIVSDEEAMKDTPPYILKGQAEAIERICKEYNIDFNEPVYEWDYGYWSGILAALRWGMGGEKNDLDT